MGLLEINVFVFGIVGDTETLAQAAMLATVERDASFSALHDHLVLLSGCDTNTVIDKISERVIKVCRGLPPVLLNHGACTALHLTVVVFIRIRGLLEVLVL